MFNIIKKWFNKSKPKKEEIYYMDKEPDDLSILENPKYKAVTYRITSLEAWRIEQFKKEHENICHTNGYGYGIMFEHSSGIGTDVICVCGKCGKKCNVTDVSCW